MTTLIIIGIIVLLAIFFISYYNKFVSLRNKVRESWSNIDIQLKRRYDLIPSLVETVKAYASHEKGLLEEVARLRSNGIQAKSVSDHAAVSGFLSDALGKLMMVAENYPELKANQNFMQLQTELSEIEENIQLSRRYYNAVARDNNNAVEKFPGVIFASMYGFKVIDFFEIAENHRDPVKLTF